MKNKVKLRKFLLKIILIITVSLIISSIINIKEYYIYQKNFNYKLSDIINLIKEKYPNVNENEIVAILNGKNSKENIFQKYNIDLNKDSVIKENKKVLYNYVLLNNIFLFILIGLIILIFLRFNKNKDKEIEEITKYIEQINKKNYKLKIDDNTEDELSILKNEIYKTTIMLKSQAENSNIDKLNLKKSLSDISHQLKTPLTSITIMLDNILEEEQMDVKIRQDFLFEIKREINNINFLIQNLLKLSKLDTNTVKYNKERINLKTILLEAIKKLKVLCDLRNISIILNVEDDVYIVTDFTWQVEAFTNILKNCIEHSMENGKIEVGIEKNKIYSQVIVKDFGKGISKKDLPHIFERFYKGDNSSKDSIGIGLSLAKTIIEQSNGKIFVESKSGVGSNFTIKYY